MDSHATETSLTSREEADVLLECWSMPVSALELSTPLYHALCGTALLVGSHPVDDGQEDIADDDGDETSGVPLAERPTKELLGHTLRLLGAERAFLFTAERDTTGRQERLQLECLVAVDLDGELINHPEKKAPREVLVHVASSGVPVSQEPSKEGSVEDVEESSNQTQSFFVALPVSMDDEVIAVLFVENRFRSLIVSREVVFTARIHCQVLAALLEVQHLRQENLSLWNDVSRLLEAQPETVEPARLVSHAPRKSKNTKRSDLKGDYSMIVGSSARMIEIFETLDRISTSNAPVLINGESGTGKELVANAIHKNSNRGDRPFVSENCGALTETLLESELFGYMKGSFTGATKDRKGLFELASGGTLFLDEVGDMSPSMQKKLLRVLQERVVRRVGGKDLIPVDVRIISATNKDLLEEVRAGNFREDLYYRLNVINLKLPPLRERKEDVAEIAECFLNALIEEHGETKGIDAAAVARLVEYDWPGNIRELQNEIKRLYALSEGDIKSSDLSHDILRGRDDSRGISNLESDLSNLTLKDAVERVEEYLIRSALVECRGNKSLVAKKLQVPKTSLYNKINKYDLNRL